MDTLALQERFSQRLERIFMRLFSVSILVGGISAETTSRISTNMSPLDLYWESLGFPRDLLSWDSARLSLRRMSEMPLRLWTDPRRDSRNSMRRIPREITSKWLTERLWYSRRLRSRLRGMERVCRASIWPSWRELWSLLDIHSMSWWMHWVIFRKYH